MRPSDRPVAGSEASPVATNGESSRPCADTLTRLITPSTARPIDRLAIGSQISPVGNKGEMVFLPSGVRAQLIVFQQYTRSIEKCYTPHLRKSRSRVLQKSHLKNVPLVKASTLWVHVLSRLLGRSIVCSVAFHIMVMQGPARTSVP